MKNMKTTLKSLLLVALFMTTMTLYAQTEVVDSTLFFAQLRQSGILKPDKKFIKDYKLNPMFGSLIALESKLKSTLFYATSRSNFPYNNWDEAIPVSKSDHIGYLRVDTVIFSFISNGSSENSPILLTSASFGTMSKIYLPER